MSVRTQRVLRKRTNVQSTPVTHFRPHPWHGLEVGPEPPEILNAFIEITPFDLMKYEIDKVSGYLRVDRPQRSSAQHPTLYGFVPRTYCDERVRKLAPGAKRGDGTLFPRNLLTELFVVENGRIRGIYAAMHYLSPENSDAPGWPVTANQTER